MSLKHFLGAGFILAAILIMLSAVSAQDSRPPDNEAKDTGNETVNLPKDDKAGLLRQLGLTREQIQQIRQLNMERKPFLQEAQQRFRAANRALDEAIYADQSSEDTVKSRLKDVQAAQAEVVKIRYSNEFAIRKILTPDQLVLFRGLRQKFAQSQQTKNQRLLKEQRQIDRRPTSKEIKAFKDGQQQIKPSRLPIRPRP